MYSLFNSHLKNKKYMVVSPKGRVTHFGARGYSDYTIHEDDDRKRRYIARHKKNEDWTKKGIDTAGFWSRWLLWNKVSINRSIKDIENRFGIDIKNFIKR